MADKARFIVFGCRTEDTLLVENHTDDFDAALGYYDVTSTADFKARIFDQSQGKLIDQHVIDLAAKFVNS